jgi:hypothetical protein
MDKVRISLVTAALVISTAAEAQILNNEPASGNLPSSASWWTMEPAPQARSRKSPARALPSTLRDLRDAFRTPAGRSEPDLPKGSFRELTHYRLLGIGSV